MARPQRTLEENKIFHIDCNLIRFRWLQKISLEGTQDCLIELGVECNPPGAYKFSFCF